MHGHINLKYVSLVTKICQNRSTNNNLVTLHPTCGIAYYYSTSFLFFYIYSAEILCGAELPLRGHIKAVKTTVFWNVTACILVDIYLRLEETYYFLLQDDVSDLKIEDVAPSEKSVPFQ